MLLVSLSLLNVEKIASQIEVAAYTGDWCHCLHCFYCLQYFLASTAYIDYTALNPKSHLYYSVISFVQLSEHFDKPLGHMVTTYWPLLEHTSVLWAENGHFLQWNDDICSGSFYQCIVSLQKNKFWKLLFGFRKFYLLWSVMIKMKSSDCNIDIRRRESAPQKKRYYVSYWENLFWRIIYLKEKERVLLIISSYFFLA